MGEGLAYDRCQVAVLTGIGAGDHLGDYYIEQPEQLFTVWRTLVDVVLPGGAAVLNAADPQLVEMAELCDGEVIYFARARIFAVIDGHLAAGGRAVPAGRRPDCAGAGPRAAPDAGRGRRYCR